MKPERGDVTEEEELELWRQNLLGGHSAESLLNTLYFYNGKLFGTFGLRTNGHRLLRISNIVLVDNLIIFDESLSKTFHGGLKDLKKQARYVKHICHEPNEIHDSCLQSLYRLYIENWAHFKRTVKIYLYQKPSSEQTMLASKVLSPVCNTKPKLDVSNSGNLDGSLPDVESLGCVHERTTAKNERAGFSDCLTNLIVI